MGKKAKKLAKMDVRDKEVVQNLFINALSGAQNDDGFHTLHPTEKGKKALNDIKIKKSKKSFSIHQCNSIDIGNDIVAGFNVEAAQSLIDTVITLIKSDDYGKAYKMADEISAIAEVYQAVKSDDAKYESLTRLATEIIKVAKSYYEYDKKDRKILSDDKYNAIIAKYTKAGNTEPAGLVPNRKGTKKGDIKYPLLHNNMDKSYIVREGDAIPDGVKEKDSIESFLKRAYKALGIPTSRNLKIELSPKIDGVSINGTIKAHNGSMILVDAQTRGDESESMIVKGLNGIELSDEFEADSFGCQFEAFVTKEDAERASAYLKLNKSYVSCRHAAAGIISRLCTQEDDNLLEFISLYPINTEGLDGTYEERKDMIENLSIVPKDMIDRKVVDGDLDELIDAVKHYRKKIIKNRSDLSFAVDGVVITITDDDNQKSIGRNGRTNKWQIALKFDPETAIGIVDGIHLDSGKKGYRTIQVDLENPVYIDGVEYQHIPVLSLELFNNMGLRYGSKVKVTRTGDVIPSISVIDAGDGDVIKAPTKCPHCGEELTVESKKLYCSNPECEGNKKGKVAGFLEAIGVDGYAEEFIKKHKVASIADLYKVDDKKFIELLIGATEDTKDYKLIGAIGIPKIGPARAKQLLAFANGIDNLIDTKIEELEAIVDNIVGTRGMHDLAQYIYDAMDDIKAVRKYTKKITKDFGVRLRVGHSDMASDQLKELNKLCDQNDFELVDGKSFDVLVVGNVNIDTAKIRKARDEDKMVTTLNEFIRKFGSDVAIAHQRVVFEANFKDHFDSGNRFDYYYPLGTNSAKHNDSIRKLIDDEYEKYHGHSRKFVPDFGLLSSF